jgi:MinD-like ATPase involved in chromosome partitioning or flagellar assembly
LIVNGARTAEDVKLGFAVRSVCKKYFGIDAEYLGYVNHDDEARRSVSMRRPIVDLHKDADVSIYLQRIARKLIGLPPTGTSSAGEPTSEGDGRSPAGREDRSMQGSPKRGRPGGFV